MPLFLGAPGDLPPPSSRPLSQSKRKEGEREEAKRGSDDESAASLAARLLASPASRLSSLPRLVGSAAWSRSHALLEELNARAHADASEGREEEEVPLALSAVGAGTATGGRARAGEGEGEGGTPRTRTPLSAVAAHLLVASSWRSRSLPSILGSLEERRGGEGEGKGGKDDWFLALYGLMRHDVSCANLLAVALSFASPAPRSASASALFSVPVLPPAIRALCEDETSACALAAWAARSVRWWDSGEGGRAAAARTAEAAAKAATKTAEAAEAAEATAAAKDSFSCPFLAADETALAAAASALAIFRCLAQHSEDLPPGVGAVLSEGGAGDLVPVLVSEEELFILLFNFSLSFLSLSLVSNASSL